MTAAIVQIPGYNNVIARLKKRKVVATDNRRLRRALGILLVSTSFGC